MGEPHTRKLCQKTLLKTEPNVNHIVSVELLIHEPPLLYHWLGQFVTPLHENVSPRTIRKNELRRNSRKEIGARISEASTEVQCDLRSNTFKLLNI